MLARACPPKSLSAVAAMNEHMVMDPSPRSSDSVRALLDPFAHRMCAGFDACANGMRDMLGALGGIMCRFVNLIA